MIGTTAVDICAPNGAHAKSRAERHARARLRQLARYDLSLFVSRIVNGVGPDIDEVVIAAHALSDTTATRSTQTGDTRRDLPASSGRPHQSRRHR